MTAVASSSPAGTPAHGDRIVDTVARLRATFDGGRTKDVHWRRRQLAGIERLVTEREGEIAQALARDLGRSAHETWLADVAATRSEAAYARKRVRRWTRSRPALLPAALLPATAHHRHEPLGTVLVIGPWNYPVYLSLSPVVGALAAGNTVVIKPSEHAPATATLLAELVPRYLDPEAVAVVEGDAATTQSLLEQGLDLAFFTGGPEIGAKVMETAARHLTPVVLELGGKSPAIVAADADIDVAARRIAWTKLVNSGQTCIAPDYVLVDRAVASELVDALGTAVTEFRAGEPSMMRVVNQRQFDRLAGLLDGHGGEVVLGGETDREALAVEPTIVLDPEPGSPLMTTEIFGPVLPVVPVASVGAAVEHVNRGTKPLALYLFCSSRRTERAVLDATSSGGVVINHAMMHCTAPQLSFGGVGTSGMGAYHGRWGFEAFSHRRAVLRKPARPDPGLMYPPYTDRAKRLMRRVM